MVWVGRYFSLDNDYGEHWFDNWIERENLEGIAEAKGYKHEFLMIIDPDPFKNDNDGPCHSRQERKQFWTDVLKSLHLSLETIFAEARKFNDEIQERNDSDYLNDLELRIIQIKEKYQREIL